MTSGSCDGCAAGRTGGVSLHLSAFKRPCIGGCHNRGDLSVNQLSETPDYPTMQRCMQHGIGHNSLDELCAQQGASHSMSA
jgi:hypothetical protein